MDSMLQTQFGKIAIVIGLLAMGMGSMGCSDDGGDSSDPFNNNEPNPCADVECPDGESCVVDGDEGLCEEDANNQVDPCEGVSCDEGQVCDPDSGDCVDDGGEEDLCQGVDCGALETCNDETGECVDIDAAEGYTCQAPNQLGALEGGQTMTVSGSPAAQPSTEETSCTLTESGNAVWEFETDVPLQIDVGIDAMESDELLVAEVRQEDCSDPEALIEGQACDNLNHDGTSFSFTVGGGSTYYLIVEGRSTMVPADFDLELSTTDLMCYPEGSWRCDPDEDDIILECDDGLAENPETCGSGCEDDACLGDTCENAIEVTDSVTIEGNTRPFNNTFDFESFPECTTEGAAGVGTGDTGPVTDGRDMVFYLPGLESGQVVVADTSETDQRNYFGVVEECDATNISCVYAESFDQTMEWQVEESGDYYVIVTRNTINSGDFVYSIEIMD